MLQPPLKGSNDTHCTISLTVVTSLTHTQKKNKSNTKRFLLFCTKKNYLLSQFISSSQPKIEIERKKFVSAGKWQSVYGAKDEREKTDDFCYFSTHRLYYACVRQWSGGPGFNPRSSHTKDSINGTWCRLLCTRHYKVRIKGKVELSWEWSSPRCSSYWKWSFRVRSPTLLLLILIYIYMYVYIYMLSILGSMRFRGRAL